MQKIVKFKTTISNFEKRKLVKSQRSGILSHSSFRPNAPWDGSAFECQAVADRTKMSEYDAKFLTNKVSLDILFLVGDLTPPQTLPRLKVHSTGQEKFDRS